MKIVVVVQARTGATRLPGKVLLPLDCHHVLTHVVRRVSEARSIDAVVIATLTGLADDTIKQFGREYDVSIHRGSETNVSSECLMLPQHTMRRSSFALQRTAH
jgi:spore coat polysaccharide biosynthesis protein SpsF